MASLGFSYAQAAKGFVPSSNVSSNPTSSASSDHGAKDVTTVLEVVSTPAKQTRTLTRPEKESSPTQKLPHSSKQVEEDVSRSDKPALTPEPAIEDQKVSQNLKPASDDGATNSRSPESIASGTNVPLEEQTEKGEQTPDTVDAQETSKDGDDDWEKISIPSAAAEKELRAAPPPTVNVWQQRSLAHQAKLKDQAAHRQPVAPLVQPTKQKPQGTVTDEPKKKTGGRENAHTDSSGAVSAGRGNSNNKVPREQQNSVAGARSNSQQSEKPKAQQPPPVDAQFWPTPENTIADTGRRSSAVEKLERNELADTKPSRGKKEWTALPFVPSVKFETQIPSARRGGRAANSRGRGALNTQGDRNADKGEAGSMGPPPVPKQAVDQDRGRKGNTSRSIRASSVPTEISATNAPESQQHASSAVVAKDSATPSDQPTSVPNDRISGHQTPPVQDPSRSSSRHTSSVASAKPNKLETDVSTSQNADTTESILHQSTQSERVRPPAGEGAKVAGEVSERQQSKEWQKERQGNGPKGENGRGDRRGEPRSERGRGNYRGRGSHNAFNNSSFTAPLPQNGFEPAKQPNQTDTRSRQPAQPYSSPYGSSRNNPRSQSIPLTMLQGGFYPSGAGFPQTLPPIQTDVNYGGFGQVPTGMPSSIMSAMPYGDQLGGYALISMVVTQLEYYFSLDNLCKDMYLRKNMDSQGFVPLRVIAKFRRIEALLGDSSMSYEQLRGVAQQVRNIEYAVGEDGEDRIRSRENWKDFVLPMDERLPLAQTDGVKIKSSHPRHSTGVISDFQMSNGLRSAPPNVNGFHDAFPNQSPAMHYQPAFVAEPMTEEGWASHGENTRPEEERRTSTTSPLGKVQSPQQEPRPISGNMANGHRDSMSSNTTIKENTFPDEEVAKLKVVVKDPDFQGEEVTTPDELIPARVSGLRGGAGSPEQFERIRGLQFGQTMTNTSKSNEQTIYFTQGEAPSHYLRPGYIHEDYLSLREKALSQRAEGHFGGACVPLYPLWAEFLTVPNQFNVGMYEDFKKWALEDEANGNDNGKKHLTKFYEVMLGSKGPMTERLVVDLVSIARKESGGRPTWLKLRAAWRNGATNMKTRKRLTDILTGEEQTELERGT